MMNRQRSRRGQMGVSRRRDGGTKWGMVLCGLVSLVIGVGGCEAARSTMEIRPRSQMKEGWGE